ncbi:MAG: DNA repair protein RadC [Alphaproteobacteria bacterium]|nr:DNA repair protein RadC [Alphaproteobacteria bacterium]
MSDTTHQLGHRTRLRQRFLKDMGHAMADYEVLELILTQAQPRGDTKPIAKELIKRFGSLAGVMSAEPDELTAVPGVGEAAMVALKVARAAGLRLARREIIDRPLLSAWEHVLDYCRAQLAHEKTERFHLLFLDRKNCLIADEIQQRGTVDHTPVYPREVVKRALELGATALILVHNHPSGDPTPSQDDIDITKAVIDAAAPLNIAVHDHVVIARTGEASLKSLGLM